MQIPRDAMVMVADGRKMLLFRNEGDEQHPKLEIVTHDEKIIPATSELGTDAPGRQQQAGGRGGVSGYEQTDFHQQEEDRFATDAADMLRKRALGNEFSKLIIVAPPKALGELRKHYHKEVAARLIGEIAKDFTNRPTDEIEKLIASTETRGSA